MTNFYMDLFFQAQACCPKPVGQQKGPQEL